MTRLLFATLLFATPLVAQDEPPADAPAGDAASADNTFELMKVFTDTFEQIDRNYVKEVDRRRLIEGAVRGMLAELDPYSNYIAPDELTGFTDDLNQSFGGIGVQVEFDPQLKALEIVAPLPGSPAFEVGLLSGDKIVKVDGELLSSFPANRVNSEAVKRLKGTPGEQVEVGVIRAGEDGIQDYLVTRKVIELPTVFGASRGDDGEWDYTLPEHPEVGYVRISHFTRRTAAEVRDAVKAARDAGAESLILDLRFNPGGLLTAAVEIVDQFLEEGKIVSTEGRNSRPRVWRARRFGTITDLPIAVLINRYSASASEITSAALQDAGRATVIGERSWGKGSVQNVIDVEEGQSALKLTTASYFRPSGKNIHRFAGATEDDEWGVTPNDGYLIKLSNEQMATMQREQRDIYLKKPIEKPFEDPHIQKAIEVLKKAEPPAKAA